MLLLSPPPYHPTMQLPQKVVIVTGASDGIGAATARALPTDAERFLGVFAMPTGGSFAIRKVGDAALVVSGVGLQASARLQAGRWPPPGKPLLPTPPRRRSRRP